jgi:hypothetical protein
MGVYPPGSIVMLNNKDIARVAEPETLMQPRIYILIDQFQIKYSYSERSNTLIRLAVQKELSIKEVFEPEDITLPPKKTEENAEKKAVNV